MTGNFKEPAPPTGHDPMAVWARLYQQFVRQFLVRGIKGARRIPDATGGVFYVVDAPPPIPNKTSSGSGGVWL